MEFTDIERNEIQNILYGFDCEYILQLREATDKIFNYLQEKVSQVEKPSSVAEPNQQVFTIDEVKSILYAQRDKILKRFNTNIASIIANQFSILRNDIINAPEPEEFTNKIVKTK